MSTIAVAKSAMGFQYAAQRNACRNCKHGEVEYSDRMPPYDRAGLRCKKGGFMTSNMALCNEYQAKHPTTSQGDRP